MYVQKPLMVWLGYKNKFRTHLLSIPSAIFNYSQVVQLAASATAHRLCCAGMVAWRSLNRSQA